MMYCAFLATKMAQVVEYEWKHYDKLLWIFCQSSAIHNFQVQPVVAETDRDPADNDREKNTETGYHTKLATVAPWHTLTASFPETNKYKHDLALSLRKITLVSWLTVKQFCAKHGHPHTVYLQHSNMHMQI